MKASEKLAVLPQKKAELFSQAEWAKPRQVCFRLAKKNIQFVARWRPPKPLLYIALLVPECSAPHLHRSFYVFNPLVIRSIFVQSAQVEINLKASNSKLDCLVLVLVNGI